MYIQSLHTTSPFTHPSNNYADKKATTINGQTLQNANQSKGQKLIQNQISTLQKTLQNIKENKELTKEMQAEQIKALQDEIKKLMQAKQELAQEELKKKATEKQQQQDMQKPLSEEEAQQKAAELQTKGLTNIATAATMHTEVQHTAGQIHNLNAKISLGQGPKYGGNLSSGEIMALSQKAAQYGSTLSKHVNAINQQLSSAHKNLTAAKHATEAYAKNKLSANTIVKSETDSLSNQASTTNTPESTDTPLETTTPEKYNTTPNIHINLTL